MSVTSGGRYIVLANTAEVGNTIDASQVSFGGFVGATGTPADLATYYAIEDQITDYLDDPSVGYVSLKTGNVYVTPSSDTTNGPSSARSMSLQQYVV